MTPEIWLRLHEVGEFLQWAWAFPRIRPVADRLAGDSRMTLAYALLDRDGRVIAVFLEHEKAMQAVADRRGVRVIDLVEKKYDA